MAPIGSAGRTALLGLASASLLGCVAVAAIPAVAGGIAAKKAGDYAATPPARMQTRGRQQAQTHPAPTPTLRSSGVRIVTATSLPPPDAAQPLVVQTSTVQPSLAPVPADLSSMRPGVVYAGALPAPYATPVAPTATPIATRHTRWTDVGRYIAALPTAPKDSALLVRGSTSEAPIWVPCTGVRALLVRLETAMRQSGGRWLFNREALQWLEAFQTLDIPIVFTSSVPATARPDIEAAFRDAGLGKLLGMGELQLGLTASAMPAERAAIAAQRCVIALVGRDASDFPNGLLPGNSPPALGGRWEAGWFLIDTN